MKDQIPIYVISLSRTPERRLFMQRQLDTLGLKYRFVDAVDKYETITKASRTRIAQSLDIDESVLEDKYVAIINYLKDHYKDTEYEQQKSSQLGSLGCALSHIKVYNSMVKNNIAEVCVMEDDATLLPTFPQVLKATPKFSYDILLLASHYAGDKIKIRCEDIKSINRVIFFSNRILFIKRHILDFLISQLKLSGAGGKDDRIENLLKGYGFDFCRFPKQSKTIVKILQEYDAKYTQLTEAIAPNNRLLSVIKYDQYQMYKVACLRLHSHTHIRLGALPELEKSNLSAITDDHYIAAPRQQTLLTTAYLVKQSGATEWKQGILKPNPLAIDEIPWRLYKNEQIKLRLITPPCVTATYRYLVHSLCSS